MNTDDNLYFSVLSMMFSSGSKSLKTAIAINSLRSKHIRFYTQYALIFMFIYFIFFQQVKINEMKKKNQQT